MIATKEYVKEAFHKYNALFFDEQLPLCEIKLTRAQSYLGKIQWKIERGFLGRVKRYSNYVMRISTFQELAQNQLDDVIIHEMIHYYIAFKGIRDSSPHGKIFRQMMKDINERFGRNIVISYKRTKTGELRLK